MATESRLRGPGLERGACGEGNGLLYVEVTNICVAELRLPSFVPAVGELMGHQGWEEGRKAAVFSGPPGPGGGCGTLGE